MSTDGRLEMFSYHLLSIISVYESDSVMAVTCSEKPSMWLFLIMSFGLLEESAVETCMLSNFSMRFDFPYYGS